MVTGRKIAVATSWLSKFEWSFPFDLRPQLYAVATKFRDERPHGELNWNVGSELNPDTS